MNWIQNNITDKFQLLVGTLSPAEALELLTDKYGVVTDEHSKLVALITTDDLEQAAKQNTSSLLDINVGFPPTIIVGCQNMQGLVKWEDFIEQYEKMRGVIVINDNDDNKVFGILDITTVRNLKNRDYELRGNFGFTGDTCIGDQYQLSKCSVKCAKCGLYNKLSFLDRKKLPICQNPNESAHELKLS